MDPRSQAGRPAQGGLQTTEEEAPGIRGAIRRASALFARRRVAFGTVLGALLFTDLIVMVSFPSTYRAKATVLVEPSRLPADVKPLVPSVHERIARLDGLAVSDNVLRELVAACPRLSKPRILRIFEGGTSSPMQTIREKITVEERGKGDRYELVEVSVTGEKADETAYVASRIAGTIVRLDREFRVDFATSIKNALQASARNELAPAQALVTRIEKLRAENPLIATGSEAALRAQAEQETRARDEDQVAEVEVASSLPLLESEVSRWSVAVQDEAELARRASLAADAAKAASKGPEDPRRARLSELERQLVQARSRWTDTNPEVKRLVREIELEREYLGVPADGEDAPRTDDREKRVGLAEKSSEVRPAADTPDQGPRRPGDNARFVIEAPDYRSWREAITKLEAARTRDSLLKARIQQRSAEVARLREVLEKLPEKRLELANLERDRDALEARATATRAELDRVERAWAIEVGDGKGGACTERLALAGPVAVPDSELGPDRLWILFLGFAVSLPIAALAAYLRDVRDSSLHTDDEVSKALDLPVLGVIPRLRRR